MAGSGFIVSGGESSEVLIPATHNLLDHTSAPLNLLDEPAHNLLSHAGLPGVGKVLQLVSFMSSAVDNTTTVIPLDDTIPQNTEGKEFMSLSITPTLGTSSLLIMVKMMLSDITQGTTVIGALFKDSEAGAQAVGATENLPDDQPCEVNIFHVVSASGIVAETWKARGGISDAGTCTFNGDSTFRFFGTAIKSSMIIAEIGV